MRIKKKKAKKSQTKGKEGREGRWEKKKEQKCILKNVCIYPKSIPGYSSLASEI